MGFRINTNTAALTAHTSAVMNNRNLDNSLSKLSSGLRINKAADDASGLAIANSLRSQASSLGQAINNGNDAIGLLQTADGALSEYSNILDTIKSKAVQAASDGQNTASRLAIQKDISKLMEELNTIAKTTSFNGQKLLSGAFSNKEFQMGANANETVKVSIGSTATNQIGHTSRSTLEITNPSGGSVALDITSSSTGKSIQLKSLDILSNNNVDNGLGALADEINRYTGETGISANAVVSSTTGAIKAGTTGTDFAINGVNIGSIIVSDNDNNGALLNAINTKSTQTGVSASIENGRITLTSTDGRAISVTGEGESVLNASNSAMSTIGHLDLVQNGAADFQITNKSVGAVSADINITGPVVTTQDSIVGAGSTLASGSILAQGSSVGGDTSILAVTNYNVDAIATAGSTITAGAVLKDGTTLGGKFTSAAATNTLNSDMLVTAGSTLKSGTKLAAGTVVTTAFSNATDVFNVGDVLTKQVTTNADLVLAADMTLKYAAGGATQNTVIAASSVYNTGSKISFDLTTVGSTILDKDMTIKAGSSTTASTILKSGSTVGADTTTNAAVNVSDDMELKTGSTIATLSTLAAGSTLGGSTVTTAAVVLGSDMSVSLGSTLESGSILKAGTILNQDTTQNTIFYQAGSVLKNDITTDADIVLTKDMTLLKGSTLAAASILNANDGKSGTLKMGETTNNTLADIDVTTLKGAMEAIDTVSAAITNLDTIRSGLGSVQNQIVSTINNISVTQVNVKAAESNIRDVDFAAESANFSKFNILAQSGSYAMSQANSVQQNVLKLLQ
ncbi:MAG: flagellin [Sulfurospirillum sp.]|jgi:flagellin